ncbi:src kinase-associated phosphoprotein 2 isoform X2 [Hyla sarda]|uniref:src kinase-associated phosphoprotein 2 isoform X2 n=1 Tax=Hyla sarda TaxID=327740 RepID=UPI0024C2EAE0|nr:src kinase-associated phosphoprotein 2 isoform X2 [Hyla sarda]
MTQLLPEDIRNIITDLESYLCDVLKGETLSKKAKDKKDALIKKIKDIKSNYPQEFHDKGDSDDVEDLDGFPRPPDTYSLASDRDKDEELTSDGNLHPPVAAQDLEATKAGYLEKRRKDHSFFASEWQKRWCVLSLTTFYYYGSDKDKQQKGEFSLEGYSARINNTLRKDGKKDCCFEIYAADKRVYQFAASTPKEAEEWVNAIQQDGETYDDVTQPTPTDECEDIYEEVPGESSNPVSVPEIPKPLKAPISQASPSSSPAGKETDYKNFYRGLWDCTGENPDELSFKHGDVIYILSKEYNIYGWWVGEMKGSIGLVPKAYIMEMYDI